MRWVARLRSVVRARLRASQLERDVRAELQSALDELTDRHQRRGLPAQAARRAARHELSGAEHLPETVRAGGVAHMLDTLGRDLVYGWRGLIRTPGFTGLVILVLAGGIGAATAIFSVVSALLLSPLPYRDGDRLVFVWQDLTRAGYPRAPLAGPELQDLRDRARLFDGFGGIWANTAALTGEAEPEQLRIGLVTPDFFQVLGAEAALGRTFRVGDDARDAPSSILLSAPLWRRRYGADPQLVGRRIQVNNRPVTVVGVMPDSFRLLLPPDSAIPDDQQAWMLLGRNLAQTPRQQQFLRVVGRMKQGVVLAEAQTEIASIGHAVAREFAEYGAGGATFYAVSLHEEATRDVRPALLALFGAVSLLLTIGCVNVAGLLVARAAARQRETAVRLAIGASRARVFRQRLIEGLMLSGAGGAAGVLLAHAMLAGLISLRPAALNRIDVAEVDVRVLLFAAAISMLWGVLFSLAPLQQLFRANLVRNLQSGGRTDAAAAGQRVRGGLLAAQSAISIVLLITAGLLARGFYELQRADAGFTSDGIVTFKLSVSGSRFRALEEIHTFSRQLRERIAALPGVQGAGAISHLPYDTVPNWGTAYLPDGAADEREAGLADARAVTPGYFQVIGARLLAGRFFDETDSRTSQPVAIVDTRLASRLWPGQDPLGKRLKADPGTTGRPGVTVTIVGVIRHLRHREITRDLREQIYFPAEQSFRNPMAYAIRTATDPGDVMPAVRRVIQELDPALPVYDVRPLAAYTSDAKATRAFTLVLAGAFAAAALFLSCVGAYGVTAYSVTQRRREFGVRLALGATGGQVVSLVLRDWSRIVAIGTLAGCAGALAMAQVLRAQLYSVTPRDPATYLAGVAVVLVTMLLACWIPAARAARVSPLESLRIE
jgi:putative ABC transport system permease protein